MAKNPLTTHTYTHAKVSKIRSITWQRLCCNVIIAVVWWLLAVVSAGCSGTGDDRLVCTVALLKTSLPDIIIKCQSLTISRL